MSTKNAYILRLIEEEVNRVLVEQEEAPEPTPEPAAADAGGGDLDLGGGDAAGAEGDLDLGGDVGAGGDLDLGGDAGAGGDLGDLGGEGGLEGEEGDLGDEGGDLGGGFGGGFGGGGGFDFGDDGETGLDADGPEEEDSLGVVGPEDVEIPDDPVMAITDDAISLLNQTRNPALILKSTKASIQRYFGDFEDATPVIKALWDTEDVTLRDVARRLLLFIKGN